MLSTKHAAIIILCMLVIVLVATGCTKGSIKSTTTYNLNRETNQVEGTITNNDPNKEASAEITVSCTTLMGVKKTADSTTTERMRPGETVRWKSPALPGLPAGDSFTTCSIDSISYMIA